MPHSPRKKTPVKKTLDRVLSKAGIGSRTEARKWIAQGRVAVDGKKIHSPDAWVDPASQRVTFDGKPLKEPPKKYLLLYKPTGYLTTYKDPDGRPTVYDLLRDVDETVRYAGRLDLDTSGLLILTNDTAFSDFISSPESHVPKTYLVKASERLSDEQLEQLRRGVELSDGPARAEAVVRLRDSGRRTFVEITIAEGRNRQVRRMIEALGVKVMKLVRVRIGTIGIGELQIGKYRELTAQEIRELMRPRAGAARDRIAPPVAPADQPRSPIPAVKKPAHR